MLGFIMKYLTRINCVLNSRYLRHLKVKLLRTYFDREIYITGRFEIYTKLKKDIP